MHIAVPQLVLRSAAVGFGGHPKASPVEVQFGPELGEQHPSVPNFREGHRAVGPSDAGLRHRVGVQRGR